jgi:hypothetical protein
MKIDVIPVKKILLSDLPNLDPVNLYLEDTGPGQGTVVLSCHQKSWTTGWSAMGKDRDLVAFMKSCDTDYLVNCFSPGLSSTKFSVDELMKLSRRIVLGRRRSSLAPADSRYDYDSCDKEEARDLYNSIEDLSGYESIQDLPHSVMEKIFGEEWWFKADQATEPNPSYLYLARIIETVREALSSSELTAGQLPVAPATVVPPLAASQASAQAVVAPPKPRSP